MYLFPRIVIKHKVMIEKVFLAISVFCQFHVGKVRQICLRQFFEFMWSSVQIWFYQLKKKLFVKTSTKNIWWLAANKNQHSIHGFFLFAFYVWPTLSVFSSDLVLFLYLPKIPQNTIFSKYTTKQTNKTWV